MTLNHDSNPGQPLLDCYQLHAGALPIVPGAPRRDWMDATPDHYAYRCTPMTIANCSGWEIRSDRSFSAEWDGNAGMESITLTALDGLGELDRLVSSHFGHGIITFHLGWLFRTSPGWALWARGRPNTSKPNIAPLEGIVETDWSPSPFTMNWRFPQPGQARFEAGETVAFIAPFPHAVVDHIKPVSHDLSSAPDLKRQFDAWQSSRGDFNRRLKEGDPAIVAQGWQRTYLKGEPGVQAGAFHVMKRRLHELAPGPLKSAHE